ncbi:MAG: integrase [Desulfurococcus sp.]|uniref:integrase n=1 Tax=Desulfurococcus sp. TaxID=51678 RepID=UPI003177BAFE
MNWKVHESFGFPRARQVVRHYIIYLYSKGVSGLDWDTYARLMLAIPGRGYGKKVGQKPVPADKVVKAFDYLKQNNEKIYLVYTLTLYSGVRFEHVINALNFWNPNEELYIVYLDIDIKRIACFMEHGFYRYYSLNPGSTCRMIPTISTIHLLTTKLLDEMPSENFTFQAVTPYSLVIQ